MLYKLSWTDGRFGAIKPVDFSDFASFGQLENDLEDLVARNILGVLFEDAGLSAPSLPPQQTAEDRCGVGEPGSDGGQNRPPGQWRQRIC